MNCRQQKKTTKTMNCRQQKKNKQNRQQQPSRQRIVKSIEHWMLAN